MGYHDTHIAGVTVSRVINDVAVINQLLSEGIITFFGDLLILGSILVVMLSMMSPLVVCAARSLAGCCLRCGFRRRCIDKRSGRVVEI